MVSYTFHEVIVNPKYIFNNKLCPGWKKAVLDGTNLGRQIDQAWREYVRFPFREGENTNLWWELANICVMKMPYFAVPMWCWLYYCVIAISLDYLPQAHPWRLLNYTYLPVQCESFWCMVHKNISTVRHLKPCES